VIATGEESARQEEELPSERYVFLALRSPPGLGRADPSPKGFAFFLCFLFFYLDLYVIKPLAPVYPVRFTM